MGDEAIMKKINPGSIGEDDEKLVQEQLTFLRNTTTSTTPVGGLHLHPHLLLLLPLVCVTLVGLDYV